MPKQKPNQVEGHELGIGIGCTCLADLQRTLDAQYPKGATLDLCQKILTSAEDDCETYPYYRDFHPVYATVKVKDPETGKLRTVKRRYAFRFCPLCGVNLSGAKPLVPSAATVALSLERARHFASLLQEASEFADEMAETSAGSLVDACHMLSVHLHAAAKELDAGNGAASQAANDPQPTGPAVIG